MDGIALPVEMMELARHCRAAVPNARTWMCGPGAQKSQVFRHGRHRITHRSHVHRAALPRTAPTKDAVHQARRLFSCGTNDHPQQ